MDCLEELVWVICALIVMGFWWLAMSLFFGWSSLTIVIGGIGGAITLYLGDWCCNKETPLGPP